MARLTPDREQKIREAAVNHIQQQHLTREAFVELLDEVVALRAERDALKDKAEMWRSMAEGDQRTIMEWQSTASEARLALIPLEAERGHLKGQAERLAAERDSLKARVVSLDAAHFHGRSE